MAKQKVFFNGFENVYGEYSLTKKEIIHKIERWHLNSDEKYALLTCLDHENPIIVSGMHGATGKTSLVERLNSLGLIAYEIDINEIVMMNTLIKNRF